MHQIEITWYQKNLFLRAINLSTSLLTNVPPDILLEHGIVKVSVPIGKNMTLDFDSDANMNLFLLKYC